MPSLTSLVDGTVPVAADFNGNFTALNRVCGVSTSLTGYTAGDMVYASATDTLSALAKGTSGQVLTMGASFPAWSSAAGLVDQLSGLGLSNNAGDATNDIDIAVGACASDDAALANRVLISLTGALTKQLDVAWAVGTNQGMRATGGAIADTTYHIFAILRPDTGVVDIAADTSATGANIAANTNAAYTKMRRLGSILREAGVIVPFTQYADEFWRNTPTLDVDSTNPGTSAVTRTLKVPLGVKVKAFVNVLNVHGSNRHYTYLSSLDTVDLAASKTVAPLATVAGDTALADAAGGQAAVWTDTSAQIRSRLSASGASDIIRVATLGWLDRRGRG